MTVFTEDAMERPLFDESMEDIERADEWSGPHGFLFDPMTYPTKVELARQFLDAAILLTKTIQRKEFEDYKLANPVLFLYRHSIELILKCAVGGDVDGHKLDVLADIFARRCKEQYSQDVPAWITARLKEIAKFDPNSTAFRYAEIWDSQSKRHVLAHGEFHINLDHLQRAMIALFTALEGVVGKIKAQGEP